MVATRATWLYDGDCGPCDRSAERFRTRIRPPADVRPYQSIDLAAAGIEPEEALRGPILLRADGSHVVGPESVAELLAQSRPPFRQLGSVMLAPGIRQALRALGPHLYRQRHRLPGAGSGCRIDAAANATVD
ncbi:MAG: DUF393 domain-containing protein [Actinobacteria bacterium]|nr:DUF393 domain-containing protein [Actinomycetota bacterium]